MELDYSPPAGSRASWGAPRGRDQRYAYVAASRFSGWWLHVRRTGEGFRSACWQTGGPVHRSGVMSREAEAVDYIERRVYETIFAGA